LPQAKTVIKVKAKRTINNVYFIAEISCYLILNTG